tara:strand:- start:32 stop:325 length:294 start_codon:yes stop_codon:yes gene_type:complete
MKNEETLLKKINGIEKMMWENRKFFINMMIKLDKVVKFVSDLTDMEGVIFGADTNNKFDEEKILKSIMEDLKNDIDDKKEEFIKYHKMINSDQVGES